jgi:hypothetical protein
MPDNALLIFRTARPSVDRRLDPRNRDTIPDRRNIRLTVYAVVNRPVPSPTQAGSTQRCTPAARSLMIPRASPGRMVFDADAAPAGGVRSIRK